MSQIGKAYVEILADLKKFPADFRAKLKAALKEGLEGADFSDFEAKAAAAGGRAGNAAGETFNRKVKEKVKKGGEDSGKGFLSGLIKVFDKEKNSKGNFFESVSSLFSKATETGLKGGAEKLGQLANVGGQVGSALSGIGGTIGSIAQVAAIAILIPVIVQLAGAVVQLGAVLFALPAAAGVAAAAIAPLIIAFQGMGEAIGAGLSGDTEKFNEALKGLTPSARAVAKEIVGLGPAFKAIKATVQESFFAPLVGALKPLATTLLPALGKGLALVGKQLGVFAAGFVELLTSNDIIDDLNDVFQSTARIVKDMAPSLINLFGVFFGIMEKGLPFVERFFGYLADGADALTGFLSRIQQTGELNKWLERAGHILKTTFGIAKEFGEYLIALLGGEIGDNGTQFLDDFREKLQDLLVYIKSPDGQESIHNLAVLIKGLANIFIWLIGLEPAALRFFNDFFDAVRAVGHFFAEVGRDVSAAASAVGGFFSDVWDWIKGAGSAIGNFFTDTIPSWWDSVVTFFASLPDRVVAALQDFADSGRAFLLDAMQSWYHQVFEWIGNIIAIIWSLPQLIPAAFQVLNDTLHAWWDRIWGDAKAIFIGGLMWLMWFFNSIPGWLADAGSAIWGFVVDLWNRTVVDSYNTVEAGFNRVMDFFRSLPDRIRALGPALYLAAVQLGHKIGEGLSNIGSFASDIGHKIVRTIVNGVNWVIDSINGGIAEIDDKLPGSLPRIPHLARGAVVDSPTLALVGEAGPEVVVPLSNPSRAQELAKQSGLLSMLRGVGAKAATQVIVYLDPSGVLIPIAKSVVNDMLDEQGHELAFARAA